VLSQAGIFGTLRLVRGSGAVDLAGDIRPDGVLESFADLPEWWRAHVVDEVISGQSN
jgi:hypothetical protein